MAPESKVDRAAMALAAGDVDDAATIIKGLQIKLEDSKGKLRAGWEGEASMSFEGVFNAFNRDFNQVLKALEGMHMALVQTKITYDSREEMSRDAVSRVQALLSGA